MNNLKRKNFSPHEFFVSDTARKLGIENYPTDNVEDVLKNLESTADMMQEIRDLLGHPIVINSAYRCKTVNDAVGSNDKSQHLKGLACDFTCKGFGEPKTIVKFLKEKEFKVDQCFNEGTWVHISRIRDVKNRMMYGHYLPNEKGKRVFKPLS